MPNSSFYRLLRPKEYMRHVHVFFAMMGCGKTHIQSVLSELMTMDGFRSVASILDSDNARLSDPVSLTTYIDLVARDAWSPETILFTNNWRAAQHLVCDGAYLHSAVAWGLTAVDTAKQVIADRGSNLRDYHMEEWIKSPEMRYFLDSVSNNTPRARDITQSADIYRLDLAPEWPIIKQHVVSVAERDHVSHLMLDRVLRLLLTFIKEREAIATQQMLIADRITDLLHTNQSRLLTQGLKEK